MLCPFIRTGTFGKKFPCRQCLLCRINNWRCKVARLLLEDSLHGDSTFATFTYAVDPPELVHSDFQNMLKKFRRDVGEVRYFMTGEYGGKFGRPHYHAVLFGYHPDELCQWVDSRKPELGNYGPLVECWRHGHVSVGDMNEARARYASGYVTKKMTRRGDPRLRGRSPEYMRCSLRPGLASQAAPELAKAWVDGGGYAATGHEPREVRVGGAGATP